MKGQKRIQNQQKRRNRTERVNGAEIEVERGWMGQTHYIVVNNSRSDGSRCTFPTVCQAQAQAHDLALGR